MAKPIPEKRRVGLVERGFRVVKLIVLGIFSLIVAMVALALWLAPKANNRPQDAAGIAASPTTKIVPAVPTASNVAAPAGESQLSHERGSQQVRATIARPGGAGNFHLAIDRESFEKLQDVVGVPGKFGEFRRMLNEEHSIYVVPNGARALVLGSFGQATRVGLLDGPQTGRDGYVNSEYVALEHKTAPPEVAEKPELPDPEKQAAIVLGIAKQLKDGGKSGPARKSYQRVVDEFPGTQAAKAAAIELNR